MRSNLDCRANWYLALPRRILVSAREKQRKLLTADEPARPNAALPTRILVHLRRQGVMRKIAFLIVLFGLCALPAFAQRTTGAIRGTVTDTSGAVVPGATVTATSQGTGLTRSTVTNQEGVYAFEELPVG